MIDPWDAQAGNEQLDTSLKKHNNFRLNNERDGFATSFNVSQKYFKDELLYILDEENMIDLRLYMQTARKIKSKE